MVGRVARLGAVGAAIGGLVLTGTATSAGASGEPDGVVSTAAPDLEQREATTYWTPDRMRTAEPVEYRVRSEQAATQTGATQGEPRSVAATTDEPTDEPTTVAPKVEPQAFPELGSPWDGGGEVTESVGRVFFTHQGTDSSCSATVVTSDNQSTVITAGHCVYLDGEWHDNWVFVPGYHDGAAPYGEWPAQELLATSEWEAAQDMNYDVGAVVVDDVNGESIQDAVGSQGIAFNMSRRFDAYNFGYPAQPPYDGEALIYSSGTTFDDTFGDSSAIGIDSDQTGGTSGGPWFRGFDESSGAGTVNTVTSFGYTTQPDVLYGPYFGAEAEALYDSAQRR